MKKCLIINILLLILFAPLNALSFLDHKNLSVKGNTILYKDGKLGMGVDPINAPFHVGVPTRYQQSVYRTDIIENRATSQAVTIDWEKGPYQSLTIIHAEGDITITFNPPPTSAILYLSINYVGIFTHDIIWPQAYKGQFGLGPLFLGKHQDNSDAISFYYTFINGEDNYYAFPVYQF
jgi:hypothetical protein